VVKDEVRPPIVTDQASIRGLVRRVQPTHLALFFLTADSRPLIAAEGDPGIVVHLRQR
jgi:hypothetical protein